MNKNIDKNTKHFSTNNLYVGAFLIAKNLSLINIDKTNPRRALFIFIDTAERKHLIHQYSFATNDSIDCMVDVRKFIQAIKVLKERLYQQ